jgi:hypothetical protein
MIDERSEDVSRELAFTAQDVKSQKNKATLSTGSLRFFLREQVGTPPPVAKRDRLSSVRHASRLEAIARTAPASFSRKKTREKRQQEEAQNKPIFINEIRCLR